MARNSLALGLIVAALPVTIARADDRRMTAAPPGTAETRYCMRIEAPLGSRIEPIACLTRDQWSDQGVDVDREWPKEGVRTEG